MDNFLVKRILMIIPFIFYIVLGIFLVLYLQRIDYSIFKNTSFDMLYLLIATFFGIVVRYWGAYIWIILLGKLSNKKPTNIADLFFIYAKSWIARYIPGSVAWIASKVYFASKLGISKNKLAVSSLLEAGLQVTVVMGSALALLLLDSRFQSIDITQRLAISGALLLCIVALVPYVFNMLVSLVYRIVKRKSFPKEHYVTGGLVIRGSLLYLAWSLLGGLSLFFIAKTFYPALGYSDLFFVMGVSNLAGALSMLAFFAPSGLGVREGIQLALLSLIIPTEIALVITIATRLWSVLVDFIFFGLAKIIQRIVSKRSSIS
jgi:glycosyltransferase 2 family protein